MGDLLEIPKDEKLSLKERVYVRLKKAITEGLFQPGAKLVETELASRLGVSRTPVREALQLLAKEGLVTILPRRGVIVESLSLKDVEEIFLLREVLEGLAAALAAQRVQEAEVKELEKILARCTQADDSNDFRKSIEANTEFHAAIFRAARSPRLQDLLQTVLDQIASYRDITMAWQERLKEATKEHRLILAAIKRGDPAAAENLLRQHVSNARELCLKLMREERAAE